MKLLCATAALLVTTTVHAAAAAHNNNNVQYAPYLLFSAPDDEPAASCTAEELTMVMDTLQAAIPGTGLAPQALVDNVQFCSSFAQGSYCEEPTESTTAKKKDPSSLRASSVVARGLAFVNPYCIFSGTGKCSVKKFNAVAPPASALPAAVLPNTTNATTAAAAAATNATTPATSNRTGGGRLLPMTFDQLCKFGGTGKCTVKKFNAVAPPPPSSLPAAPPLAALNGTTTNTTGIATNATTTANNRTLQHAAAQEATPPLLHHHDRRALNGNGPWCKWMGIGCTGPNYESGTNNNTLRHLTGAQEATPPPLHNYDRRALNGNGPWCKWMGIGCTGPNYEKGANNNTLRHLTVVGDHDDTLCDAEFAALDAALLQLLPEVSSSSSCRSLLQAPRVQHCLVVV
jgi:hypothetical protein